MTLEKILLGAGRLVALAGGQADDLGLDAASEAGFSFLLSCGEAAL